MGVTLIYQRFKYSQLNLLNGEKLPAKLQNYHTLAVN